MPNEGKHSVGEQDGRRAVVDAVVNGVVTGAWYALPDVVASRRARGVLKVALLLGGAARSVPTDEADDGDSAGAGGDGGKAPVTDPELSSLVARMSTEPVIGAEALGLGGEPSNRARRATVIAVALATLSVVGTVAGERAIHRWGQRLTARGVRGAHTRIGLVAGAVTGVGTWALGRRMTGKA